MKRFFFLPLILFSLALFAQQAGSSAEILWNGIWYKGTIIEVKDNQYKVHYNGCGSNWDEWVSASRLRNVGGKSTLSTPTAVPKADPSKKS
ncbi:MAG: hypothetical protein C4330_13825 [Chitinophagaceae bacterium]